MGDRLESRTPAVGSDASPIDRNTHAGREHSRSNNNSRAVENFSPAADSERSAEHQLAKACPRLPAITSPRPEDGRHPIWGFCGTSRPAECKKFAHCPHRAVQVDRNIFQDCQVIRSAAPAELWPPGASRKGTYFSSNKKLLS